MNSTAAARLAWLHDRWSALRPELRTLGADLAARYADPSRAYHDLRHLVEVLVRVDTLCAECSDPAAVELAAWFHDAVYDPTRSDNEAASASLAVQLLTPYEPVARVAEVERLVLLTQDHAVAVGDHDGAVLCDADLAVLAGTPTDYDDYARRVRREFAHVADNDFRSGRSAVLQGLLSLPALFHTGYGVQHWEPAARANLERELAALRHGA